MPKKANTAIVYTIAIDENQRSLIRRALLLLAAHPRGLTQAEIDEVELMCNMSKQSELSTDPDTVNGWCY